MSLTVNLKTQRGIIYNRQFLPGEGISIYGKASTLLVPYNPGTLITIDVTTKTGTSIYSNNKTTDYLGDYDFWFRTPLDVGKLNIKLVASYPVSGQDVVNVPIGIGTQPDQLPTPESEFSLLSFLPVALFGLGLILFLKK